ncbi:hypothetical protein [Flavobacterium sp.]|uniref:hypothetical protein n=1 Tax=Flavobacterium sp. TaxID=239 RepID=UPI00374D6E27
MSERKNIERLFQEKFKDYEATPSSQVWENIASKLEKKESKKRVIPFWFNVKAAGIAAAFILGIFTVNNYTNSSSFNKNNNNSKTLVSIENNEKKPLKTDIENPEKSKILNTKNPIVQNQKNYNSTTNNNVSENSISNQNKSIVENQNDEIIKNEKSDKKNVISNKENASSTSKKGQTYSKYKSRNTSLASSEITSESDTKSKNKLHYSSKTKRTNSHKNKDQFQNSANEIATNSANENSRDRKSNSSVSEQAKQTLISSVIKSSESDNSSPVLAQNNVSTKTNSSADSDENSKKKVDNLSSNSNNSSIANTAIQKQNFSEIILKDSIIVAVVEENPLDKILKEKEIKDIKEEKIVENSQKWKVKPNVAPLFMSATQGSPIDNQFADNAKNFENNLSLGFGIDYAVTNKISIRTGINKFDFSYSTNDIVYYANISAKNSSSSSNLKTIDVTPEARNMVIEDKKSTSSQEIAIQTKDEGLLNQKTGYVEVPVEVSYKLLDKKFGIQVITGFSSLFLNENEVSVVSSGLTTIVGEANNLNKVHFSTNIGLGFKYSFWKSFEANFEPTFKYQINTFNANSGGFKPYLIGLYSGISFKF